ncbi:MAG: hypothetical protein GY780_03860 [bacterium]|nr:hypothetical protein [bacterium]
MKCRLSIMVLVALSLVAMATAASAAYFTAPEYVIAQENGHFLVAMTIYTGSGDAVSIDHESLLGTVNCSEDRSRDQGCGVTIETGEVYHFIYEGYLDDADIDGVVELGVHFCNQENLVATIEVLNASTVATEAGNWDTLKAQYR